MKAWLILALVFAMEAGAVQLVTHGESVCRELDLPRELPIYKDPDLFLSSLQGLDSLDALRSESPVITKVQGKVSLMRVGPPQIFKNFRHIARLYELADPRLKIRQALQAEDLSDPRARQRAVRDGAPKIIPVMLCGRNNPYADTLGFILLSDLERAKTPPQVEGRRGMPPSTPGNPIPEWKGRAQAEAPADRRTP